MLLAVSKQIVVRDCATRNGRWPRDLVEPIRRKTIGILGLGRIGRSMAIRSSAMGMRVIAHDVAADQAFAAANQVELVDFDSLIERCDVLSIHCPVTDVTRGIINRQGLRETLRVSHDMDEFSEDLRSERKAIAICHQLSEDSLCILMKWMLRDSNRDEEPGIKSVVQFRCSSISSNKSQSASSAASTCPTLAAGISRTL